MFQMFDSLSRGFLSYRSLRKFLVRPFLLSILTVIGTPALASATGDLPCRPRPASDKPGLDLGFNDLGAAIAADLQAKNYKAVIEAADVWRAKDCRLGDGEPMATYWLYGFTTYFRERNDWEASYRTVSEFRAKYARHPLAALAEARYWSDYAEEARGTGYATTVTPEGWALFRERLEKSESILQKAVHSSSSWPHWYWQTIRVESLLNRPPSLRQAIYDEGIRKFPVDLGIYDEMSHFMEPKWGGSWKAVDAIVIAAVENASPPDADLVYARLYRSRGDYAGRNIDFMGQSAVSWPRMRKGLKRLLELNPRSTLLANSLLSYACLATDKQTYLFYRPSVSTIDLRAWRSLRTLEACDTQFGYSK